MSQFEFTNVATVVVGDYPTYKNLDIAPDSHDRSLMAPSGPFVVLDLYTTKADQATRPNDPDIAYKVGARIVQRVTEIFPTDPVPGDMHGDLTASLLDQVGLSRPSKSNGGFRSIKIDAPNNEVRPYIGVALDAGKAFLRDNGFDKDLMSEFLRSFGIEEIKRRALPENRMRVKDESILLRFDEGREANISLPEFVAACTLLGYIEARRQRAIREQQQPSVTT